MEQETNKNSSNNTKTAAIYITNLLQTNTVCLKDTTSEYSLVLTSVNLEKRNSQGTLGCLAIGFALPLI